MVKKLALLKVSIIFLCIFVLLFAGIFGIYQYQQVVGENKAMEQQLLESKDREIEQLRLQLDDTSKVDEAQDVENEEGSQSSPVAEDESPSIKEVVRTVTEYVQAPTPVVPAPDTNPTAPVVQQQDQLVIFNFNTIESGDSTKATWETNLPSDSRILIDDSFYVSDASEATRHSVRFTDLKKGQTINYEIVATTDSQEVSQFGKFTTRPGEIGVRFAYSKDEDCMVVVLEDEYGTAQPGVSLRISGVIISGSGNRILPTGSTITDTTTAWGEIEYCNKVQEIKVQNTDTGEYYYDGRIYLF